MIVPAGCSQAQLKKLDGHRCTIFLGLLVGCAELQDGTAEFRTFPELDCDEIEHRVSIGLAGTLLLCVGIPGLCVLLITLYLKRKFKSALSYFLVRSIFSGHRGSWRTYLHEE